MCGCIRCVGSVCRVKCGSVEFYDKQYDRTTAKNEKKLMRINRVFHTVSTTDDPIIRQVHILACDRL